MSGSIAVDAVARLRLAHTGAVVPRVWSGESVRLLLEINGLDGKPLDVGGVTFAVLAPDGTEIAFPPSMAVRVSAGRVVSAVTVRTPGLWRCSARGQRPSPMAAACTFQVVALPAGQPPPATALITHEGFPLLSPSGALVTA